MSVSSDWPQPPPGANVSYCFQRKVEGIIWFSVASEEELWVRRTGSKLKPTDNSGKVTRVNHKLQGHFIALEPQSPSRWWKLFISSLYLDWYSSCPTPLCINCGKYECSYAGGLVAKPCPALCDPMDCSLPGSSVRGILQARILKWVAMSSSRGSFWPRDQTHISYVSWVGKWILYH